MIAALVVFTLLFGALIGALMGSYAASTRTEAARYVRNHLDALMVLRDLVNNPDGRDLRPRAQAVIDAHRDNVMRKAKKVAPCTTPPEEAI